jgi:hypothetical protein
MPEAGAIHSINGAPMPTMPDSTFMVRQVWMAASL